jgi:hypothetical protein
MLVKLDRIDSRGTARVLNALFRKVVNSPRADPWTFATRMFDPEKQHAHYR